MGRNGENCLGYSCDGRSRTGMILAAVVSIFVPAATSVGCAERSPFQVVHVYLVLLPSQAATYCPRFNADILYMIY